MLKRIITASLFATALMFSGCGSANSEGEKLLALKHAQDQGDPAGLQKGIDYLLNGQDLNTSLKTMSKNDKLTLATSYMSLSGFGMTDIIAIATSKDANASADQLQTFKAKVLSKQGPNALENVTNAIACYDSIGTSAPALSASANTVVPKLSEATFRRIFAILIKAVLLLTNVDKNGNPTASNQEIATFLNHDVFGYFKTNPELDFVRESMEKLKVEIASKAGANKGITFDSNQYSQNNGYYDNVTIEAADIATYR